MRIPLLATLSLLIVGQGIAQDASALRQRIVVLLDKRPPCYTETVVETYCYPTLGKVECFHSPAAHRTRVNNDMAAMPPSGPARKSAVADTDPDSKTGQVAAHPASAHSRQ